MGHPGRERVVLLHALNVMSLLLPFSLTLPALVVLLLVVVEEERTQRRDTNIRGGSSSPAGATTAAGGRGGGPPLAKHRNSCDNNKQTILIRNLLSNPTRNETSSLDNSYERVVRSRHNSLFGEGRSSRLFVIYLILLFLGPSVKEPVLPRYTAQITRAVLLRGIRSRTSCASSLGDVSVLEKEPCRKTRGMINICRCHSQPTRVDRGWCLLKGQQRYCTHNV